VTYFVHFAVRLGEKPYRQSETKPKVGY